MMAGPRRWGEPAPVRLMPGEEVIWQGAPCWRALALSVFHLRAVTFYFVLLALVDMLAARLQHLGSFGALRAGLPGLLTGIGTALILLALAWGTGRTTRYTLTTRRVVLQFGLALPATLSLPLHRIAEASVRVRRDHAGDIALRLWPGERVSLAKLWPHARAWRVSAPVPMLRDVPQVAVLAAPLGRALAAAEVRRRSRTGTALPLAS